MMLSNDLTLIEHQLKCLLFSIGNQHMYSPLVEIVADNYNHMLTIYKGTKCKEIILLYIYIEVFLQS